MERVNKIAINVDQKYDDVRITLYRTNINLGVLTDEDLKLPRFSQSGVSIKAYTAYCKDLVIALLEKDGIPGYYYEPKAESETIKYEPSLFKSKTCEYVSDILNDKYEYKVLMTEKIDITEQYKDNYIKSATGRFEVMLTQFDIRITIISEIKSGQLCRPKVFEFDGVEYNLNITNINRIIRSQ